MGGEIDADISEKLLMFMFYTVLLIFKMFGWLVKAVIGVIVMLCDCASNKTM